MVDQFRTVDIPDLAAAFQISASRLREELAQMAFQTIYHEAVRLAHVEVFGQRQGQRINSRADLEMTPTWQHLVQATQDFLPHLASRAPVVAACPPDRSAGFVYVLFDGLSGLCKIGHTKSSGRRQRSQMSSHGHPLVNLVNAKVANCAAAELKCHEHFAAQHAHGEWFTASPEEILQFITSTLEVLSLDYEPQETLTPYLYHCRAGNRAEAQSALMTGRGKRSAVKPVLTPQAGMPAV